MQGSDPAPYGGGRLVPDTIFSCPDLTTFCRLDEFGPQVSGQRLDPDRVVLAYRALEPVGWCWACGCQGSTAGHGGALAGALAVGVAPNDAAGEGPLLRMHRVRSGVAPRHDQGCLGGVKVSHRGLGWALSGIVVRHLTVARMAEGLGMGWNTANDAMLAQGKCVLIDEPDRFDAVTAVGVDEHVWYHTRRGDNYASCDHRLDRYPFRHRPCTVVGHGRGPLQAGLQVVAG